MKLKRAHYLFLFLVFCLPGFAQNNDPLRSGDPLDQNKWVDSVYTSMSLEEKVGQLFMVSIWSKNKDTEAPKIKKLIEENHIGGLIFSKGGPVAQAKLTNEFQSLSKIPLLIGMDAEWGLSMRLDSTFAIPWNMTLGAIQDDKLIEEAAASISRHSRRLGVHFNFAPVVDINTNPDNPIIGSRSFGETKEIVARKSAAFIKGMHQEGVLSSAKHFPGHGDTNSDSHKTLPTIDFSSARIDTVELYPYKRLIPLNLSSVMVAHLNVPSLEDENGLPASISKKIITDILKRNMGFDGLIFTDALGMKGVSAGRQPGDVDLEAFQAGNDILLMSDDPAKGAQSIIEAYNSGAITEERLAYSVKKILKAKYKVDLNNYKPIEIKNLHQDLETKYDKALLENLFEKAITVLKNNQAVLPIKELKDKSIAYVKMGDAEGDDFLNELKKYDRIDVMKAEYIDSLLQKLENYDQVIIGFHKSDASPWSSYKFKRNELSAIYRIAKQNNTILSVFTKPYALLDMQSFGDIEGIVMAYQNHPVAQRKAAQIIFGAVKADGRLPVSIKDEFPVGTGFRTIGMDRLSYGLPETEAMDSDKLKEIDSLVNYAIKEKMTPGAQVIVARNGKIIYNRNFGYQTYEKQNAVTDSTIYDLASLTKILSSLPLIMELEQDKKITFDTKLKEMFPTFEGSNKANITLQDMLMHYARLSPWIPFYISTLNSDNKQPSEIYYRDLPSENFNAQVAKDMYIRRDIGDSIVEMIRDSDLESRLRYRYSDLPFYLMKYYLEKQYNSNLQVITQEHIYKELGANHTGYLPLTRFDASQIAPTENDKLWRKQLVHGYVHDQGAAMQGGIGGHAGLFSNANDVTKIMQMYLNGGTYGGHQFLKQETLDKFNTCYYCEDDVRRGVGFDKPQLGSAGPTCGCVSLSSFGHSGFTGTFAWADPDEKIVYVFLSNRVYPDSNNRKLIRENIRSKIQEVIYESILN